MELELIPIFLQSDAQDGFPWALTTMIVGFFFAVAGTACVIIWQVFATFRARMSVAREEAYRELAKSATEAQQQSADGLKTVLAELAEVRQRAMEIERILREVE